MGRGRIRTSVPNCAELRATERHAHCRLEPKQLARAALASRLGTRFESRTASALQGWDAPEAWRHRQFNVNKPYNPGAPGTLQSIAAAARRKFSR
jgi:hypothetical protein